MRARVRGFQARRLYPSVGLRRRDRGMTEQLLDRAQVGATLQQVGREGMAQRVRMDRSLDRGVACPDAQAAPDVRRREPPPRLTEEQSDLVVAARQRAAGPLQV